VITHDDRYFERGDRVIKLDGRIVDEITERVEASRVREA
jgi:ABC-type siderophore export system fused ATPase/permease subunit